MRLNHFSCSCEGHPRCSFYPFHNFHRKALLLYRLGRREEAIEADIRSIALYPWNWSAWTLLGTCVDDSEEVSWICLSSISGFDASGESS